MQVRLLVHPLGHRILIQVMLEQRDLRLQDSNSHATRRFLYHVNPPLLTLLPVLWLWLEGA
jgi:hypothetical protein